MPSTQFYPALKTLIDTDSVPVLNLGFVENTIDFLFQDLYYRDLQVNISSDTGNKYYSLVLVTYNRLALEVPGTDGMALVLNPGNIGQLTTEIPISIGVNIEILKFLQGFEIQNLIEDPATFFNMFLDVLGLDPADLLQEVLEVFLGAAANAQQAFVDQFNDLNGTAISILEDSDDIGEIVEHLVDSLEELDFDVFEVVFDDFISEVVGGIDEVYNNVKAVFARILGNVNRDDLLDLIKPDILLAINNIDLALEFPRKWLIPLETSADLDPGTEEGEPLPDPFQSRLTFNVGSLEYTSANGLRFIGENSFDFTKSQIGETGFTLEFTGLVLDLSRERNIPQAAADGRPDDFVGVFVQDAAIGLPKKWFKQESGATAELFGENLLLGTGGISGKIGLRAVGPPLPPGVDHEIVFRLGKKDGDPDRPGFQLGFIEAFVNFHQNKITDGFLKGTMMIPGFEKPNGDPADIQIELMFQEDGDFKITASEPAGVTICIKDVFDIVIRQLSVGREDDRLFIEVVGGLYIKAADLEETFTDGIEIKKLIIWDDGSFNFVGGGTITLPNPKVLKVGPVALSVTALHFGAHEQFHIDQVRKYLYFGFDGGLAAEKAGVDAKGSGIKFYFTIDNNDNPGFPDHRPLHYFMRIESIRVDLIIPGGADPADAVLLLSGYLAMKDNTDDTQASSQEYVGGIEFALPQMQIAGSAAMRMNPKVPAFLIDVNLELPTYIPLGPTGLGIYGFRGLIGQRYVASQEATNDAGASPQIPVGPDWYPFYEAKVGPTYAEGVNVAKFGIKNDGFSLGVGASIATTDPQEKKALTTKVFLLLTLPEPVLLIQGQADFVSERLGLGDISQDPPFSIMLAITSESVRAGLGINYVIKEDEAILKIEGRIDIAFFFNDASAWYIHLGTAENPILGLVLKDTLPVQVYAFLMISGKGIEAGAGASFAKEYKLLGGVLQANLEAYLDIYGKINFKPRQLGARFQVGGRVELRAFGIGVNITAGLSLATEVSNPFFVTGTLEACLEINLWIKTFELCGKIEFTWIFDSNPNVTPIPLLEPNARGSSARSMVTDETFPIYVNTVEPTGPQIEAGNYVVPMDSYIDFEFLKPVRGGSGTTNIGGPNGGSNTDNIPQKKGKLEQVGHEFIVDSVTVESWDPTANGGLGDWVAYDIYEAMSPLSNPSGPQVLVTLPDPALRKFGYWQLNQAGTKVNRLTMMAQSPLEWTLQSATPPVLEEYGVTDVDLFCPPEPIEKTCLDFLDYEGTNVPSGELQFHNETMFELTGDDGVIRVVNNPFGISNALCITSDTEMEVLFSQPTSCVTMKMLTCAESVTITFYEKIKLEAPDVNNAPQYEYAIAQQVQRTPGALITPIHYENHEQPIERIVISTAECEPGSKLVCREITPEGRDLQNLLNQLAKDNKLLSQTAVPLDETPYSTIYNPNLASYISGNHNYQAYNDPDQNGSNYLLAYIGNSDDFCRITLEYIGKGTIQFSDITGFVNIAYDPANSALGSNNTFLITAVLNDGQQVLLRGDSDCYPVVNCTEEARSCEELICEDAKNILTQLLADLERLNKELNHLIQLCEPNPQPQLLTQRRYFQQILCTQIDELEAQILELENEIINLQAYIRLCESENPDPDLALEECNSYLFELCWLSSEDYEFNLNLPSPQEVQADAEGFVDSLTNSIKPVWRPNTTFLIKVQTRDQLSKFSTSAYTNTINIGFRTLGPTGHFHESITRYNDLAANGREDEFALKRLKTYIDFDKSYPDAAGTLVATKPLFYDCPTLYLFFSYPHAYALFNTYKPYNGKPQVDIELEVLIKEAQTADEPDGSGTPVGEWHVSSTTQTTTDVDLINNLMTGGQDCFLVSEIVSNSSQLQVGICDLEPLKLYTAVYNSLVDGDGLEIHSYPFQTSHYACFKEQVESFMIEDSDGNFLRNAFFDRSVEILDADLALIPDVLDETLPDTDVLRKEFISKYDRVVDGVLKLDAIDPPDRTEFLMVRNFNTEVGSPADGEVIGIIVRNPEPFNDPKLIDPFLADSIVVVDNLGVVRPEFTVTIAKDGARVFITNDTQDITDPTLNIRFRYYTYDGQNYTIVDPAKDDVTVTVDVFAATTQLTTAFCNATEIDLKDTLEADLLAEAIDYEFKIEEGGSGFSENYRRFSDDGLFPLYEVPDLLYNTVYDVQVRPIIPGRITEFGPVCQVTTSALLIVIIDPIDVLQGETADVFVEVQNQGGNLVSDFSTSVTMQTTGSAFLPNNGLIKIVGGRGLIKIVDLTAETVTLSLVDSAGTTFDVSSTEDLVFGDAAATAFVIIDPADGVATDTIPVTVHAINQFGNIDPNFQDDVTMLASGSATLSNAGLVDIINGIGTIDVTDNVVELVELTLSDTEGTGLDVSSVQDVNFATPPAIEFVIIDPADTYKTLPVTVTVEARNALGNVDPLFNDDVTLLATGDAVVANSGLVDIVNGVGTIQVDDNIDETVTLSLSDTEGTGLDVTSTQTVTFYGFDCIFEDTFSVPSDIDLDLHTPDIGTSWTLLSQVGGGTFKADAPGQNLKVDSGGVGAGTLYTADTLYPLADYAVQVVPLKNVKDDKKGILAIRVQDGDNMYAAWFGENESQVYKKVSGTWTALGALGGGVPKETLARLEIQGSTIRFFGNNVELHNVTDTDISLPGKAGLGGGAIILAGDELGNQEMDNFKVCPVGELTEIFVDTFSGSGLLETTTPDRGVSWTQVINNGGSDGIDVGGGNAQKVGAGTANSTGSFYLADTLDPIPFPDYEAIAKMEDTDKQDQTNTLGVRVTNNGDDGYFVRYNEDTAQLYKRVAGTWSPLGTDAGGVDKEATVSLRIDGTTLSFHEDGIQILSATVTDHAAAGQAGLGIGAIMVASDDEKKQEIDRFIIRLL